MKKAGCSNGEHNRLVFFVSASRKFSVPGEVSMVRQIVRTLPLGFGISVTIRLPGIIAIVEYGITMPGILFPCTDMMNAGSVALNVKDTRLTPDMNTIT